MTLLRSHRILLEVPLASLDDALVAVHAGVDRVEVNSALEVGGLTPSLGTVQEIRGALSLPVLPMIRPRPGGFAYSAADFRVMQRDIDLMLAAGVEGIVFGVLHEDGTIDGERCRRLRRQIEGRQAVFHRAFDVTPEPFRALEELIDLGITRILTSGQEETAYCGAPLIAELIRQAAGRIEILPAGGINRFTVADVLARTGCDQIHASLRRSCRDLSTQARPHLSFGGVLRRPEDRYDCTSAEAIAHLRGLLE